MARSKKSRNKRKRHVVETEEKPHILKKQPRKGKDDVDTALYEVETILDQKLDNEEVLYKVKWKGYGTEHNSLEPEFRLMCPEKLRTFVVSRYGSRKSNEEIPEVLASCDSHNDLQFLGSGNLLSIIGKQFLTRGAVHYTEHNSLSANRRFLKAIKKQENDWCLFSISQTSKAKLDYDLKRYISELEERIQICLDYPPIKIIYPHGYDHCTYTLPPPPHFKITLTPLDSKNTSKVVRSTNKGFGGVFPFVHRDHFLGENKPISNSPQWDFLKNEQKTRKKRNPKFRNNLCLRFTEESGWCLCTEHAIDSGRPLLQMMGKLSDVSVAHTSMIEDGFPIAISSIFRIGRNKVIDQREYYDFTRFILHSCEPNCEVRMELPQDCLKYEEEEMQLVVFSSEDIRACGEELTLDFFKCYEESVESFFDNIDDPILTEENGRLAYLNENKINFVYCHCGANSCREILFIDEMMIGHNERDREDFLKNIPLPDQFKGTFLHIH